MTGVLAQPTSPEQFLAWEERQDGRYEFDGVSIRAMTGGSAAHAAIQSNLLIAIGSLLRGGPCRMLGSDLKVRVATGFRHPDALVICSPLRFGLGYVSDPVTLFEIVSPSSVNIDFVDKNREYRDIPSVRRYVVLQQNSVAAAVFSRKEQDWVSEIVAGDDAVLQLPEIGVDVPLAEIYRDVELRPEDVSETG